MSQTATFRYLRLYALALVLISFTLGFAIGTQADTGLFLRLLEIAVFFALTATAVIALLNARMGRPLAGMLHALAHGSRQIGSMTGEVARDAQGLAAATSRQAAAIQETAATVEQLAAMTHANADRATQTDRLMGETRATVTQASASMSGLFDSIQEITRRSVETSRIVKSIDEIAFQTNLLALNAAVEAARAGERGAGFAIVADEVRTLARRAAGAASETAELIDSTNRHVQEAGALVEQTRRHFGEVNDRVGQSGGFVSQIASASAEQAEGIDQLNIAITEIDNVIQQTVASAEHSAAAARDMSVQSTGMATIIERLRVLMDAPDGQMRDDRSVGTRVHLTVAVNTVVADAFAAWTSHVPVHEIRDFSGPYANRPTVDFVLQLQALAAGGLDFDHEVHVVPNNQRAKNAVVQGYADLSGETVWDAEIAAWGDAVLATSPVIGNGEFEKGLYVLPDNEAMLGVKSVEDLRPMVGATVVSWETDMRALQAMPLRRIERVFKEEGLFAVLNQGRADFTLLEFASTGDMSVARDGVRLVPVPGCKVSLPGSRSWIISSNSPHARQLATALERGAQALRREGRFERAYRQSGFFNPRVAHWTRVI